MHFWHYCGLLLHGLNIPFLTQKAAAIGFLEGRRLFKLSWLAW
jgi:hypothetical protein